MTPRTRSSPSAVGAAAPVLLRTSSTRTAELGQQRAIDAQRLALALAA